MKLGLASWPKPVDDSSPFLVRVRRVLESRLAYSLLSSAGLGHIWLLNFDCDDRCNGPKEPLLSTSNYGVLFVLPLAQQPHPLIVGRCCLVVSSARLDYFQLDVVNVFALTDAAAVVAHSKARLGAAVR